MNTIYNRHGGGGIVAGRLTGARFRVLQPGLVQTPALLHFAIILTNSSSVVVEGFANVFEVTSVAILRRQDSSCSDAGIRMRCPVPSSVAADFDSAREYQVAIYVGLLVAITNLRY